MSKRAWVYTLGVVAAAAILLCFSAFDYRMGSPDWLQFLALTALATFVQLVKTTGPNRTSYYPHFVFFFAGALMLQPFYFALLVIVPHVIEWAIERMVDGPYLRAWYIQPFNIATHLLAGLSAALAYAQLNERLVTSMHPETASRVIAALTSAALYIVINHVLIGLALLLARGISWQTSGAMSFESLLPDYIMASLGCVVIAVWQLSPWLLLPTLMPLALMRQGLMVPQLQQEAQTDSKTGLWNARHFTTLFTTELERASKFNRPLVLIMADLDLLRNINNTYGHLAGDSVLAGIGKIISDNIRQYDVAARFGGEEFAILIPEAGVHEGRELAERLRATVEAMEFEAATSASKIKATMSFGIACYPADAMDVQTLIHAADLAVYQAKLRGRNCVACASEVPHSGKLEHSMPDGGHYIPEERIVRPPMVTSGIDECSASRVHPELSCLTTTTVAAAELVAVSNVVEVLSHPAVLPNLADTNPTVHIRPPAQTGVSDVENRAAAAAPVPSVPSVPSALLTPRPSRLLQPFVAAVIAAGFLASLTGAFFSTAPDLLVVSMLVALAVAAELLQVNLYGDNTISVSVSLAFAAALVVGMPGVVLVGLAITITHYVQMRPAIYKAAFNWSVHVLAGAMPVLAVKLLGQAVTVSNLPVLTSLALVAGFGYFFTESGLVAIAIGLSRGLSPRVVWRDQFKWLTPHYVVLCLMGMLISIAYAALGTVGLLVFTVPIVMMRFSQKQYVERTEENVRELKRMNAELTNANREISQANQAILDLNEELFLTLAQIIDARDPYVGGHAHKVAEYAVAIAAELGIEQERLGPLRQAGFLHDIGKIGISEQVLHKPAKLTPEEYEYVKTHAALGGEFLSMCRGLRQLVLFVRHHHERWDGGGYPDHLAGETIPLESRILAVCDSVEAMASDRPYRRGMSPSEIIEEVKRCTGTQFDPRVAAAFVRLAEREREGLIVNSARQVDQHQLDYRDILSAHATGAKGSPVMTDGIPVSESLVPAPAQ